MIQRSEVEATAMERAADWHRIARDLKYAGEEMYHTASQDWKGALERFYEVEARWAIAVYKVPDRAWRHGAVRVGYDTIRRAPDEVLGRRVTSASQIGDTVNVGSAVSDISFLKIWDDHVDVCGHDLLFGVWPGGWIEIKA